LRRNFVFCFGFAGLVVKICLGYTWLLLSTSIFLIFFIRFRPIEECCLWSVILLIRALIMLVLFISFLSSIIQISLKSISLLFRIIIQLLVRSRFSTSFVNISLRRIILLVNYFVLFIIFVIFALIILIISICIGDIVLLVWSPVVLILFAYFWLVLFDIRDKIIAIIFEIESEFVRFYAHIVLPLFTSDFLNRFYLFFVLH